MNTRAKSPHQSLSTVLITSITAILDTINIQCHQRSVGCSCREQPSSSTAHFYRPHSEYDHTLTALYVNSLISILRQSLKNHPLGPADSH